METSFFTKVAGVTFNNTGSNTENRQRIIAELLRKGSLEENAGLDLVREPENPYDPNAIAVIAPDGRQVGFLPQDVAQTVSPNMENGKHYRAYVASVTGGNADSFYGINLKIVCTTEYDEEQPAEENIELYDNQGIVQNSESRAILASNQIKNISRPEFCSLIVWGGNDNIFYVNDNPLDDEYETTGLWRYSIHTGENARIGREDDPDILIAPFGEVICVCDRKIENGFLVLRYYDRMTGSVWTPCPAQRFRITHRCFLDRTVWISDLICDTDTIFLATDSYDDNFLLAVNFKQNCCTLKKCDPIKKFICMDERIFLVTFSSKFVKKETASCVSLLNDEDEEEKLNRIFSMDDKKEEQSCRIFFLDDERESVEIIYLIDCECDNVCGDNGSLFFFTSKGILQAHLSKDYKDIESVRYITHKYSYGDILQGMLYIPHVTGQQSIVSKGNLKGDQLTSVICFDGEIKKIQLGLKYIFYQRTAYENVLTTDNEKVIIPYESLVVKDVTTGNETEICGYYNP